MDHVQARYELTVARNTAEDIEYQIIDLIHQDDGQLKDLLQAQADRRKAYNRIDELLHEIANCTFDRSAPITDLTHTFDRSAPITDLTHTFDRSAPITDLTHT